MSLPLAPPLEPMLAKAQSEIPSGEDWVYEPKWDGFRAITFRDGDDVQISSRNALPLQRYFPELIEPLREALPPRTVVDGEVVIATPHGLDFEGLQMRIHPAASRVKMLSEQSPASVVLFDMLALGDDDLREQPMAERRAKLVASVNVSKWVGITPHTADIGEAKSWFEQYEGAGLDGVVAKDRRGPYRHGERRWVKVKHLRTVDCVVGGYRDAAKGDGIGSLLLGLYDAEDVFHFVGHTSSFSAAERRQIHEQLQPLRSGDSFGAGRTPGALSRWSRGADDASWVSVRPELVCEVSFDHMQGERFRHASRFLRWRKDKAPRDCTFDQLSPPEAFRLEDIITAPR